MVRSFLPVGQGAFYNSGSTLCVGHNWQPQKENCQHCDRMGVFTAVIHERTVQCHRAA